MNIKNGEKIEYKLKNGKIGKGTFREGRNFCYVQSDDSRPIRIKEISAIRLIRLTEEDGNEEIDAKLKSAVEADLETYDLGKLKAMGDKSKDMIVNMGKLFLIKNEEYAKDADKNGKAYTKIAAEKAGLNADGSEKSDEQKQAEQDVKEVKKEDSQEQSGNEGTETEQISESKHNKFLRRQYSRYKEDEDLDSLDEAEDTAIEDDGELLETEELDEEAEQEVLDGLDDIDNSDYGDVVDSLEDEENYDYDEDYENGYEEEEVEDLKSDEDDLDENAYKDSDDAITLSNGETIELRDLFDKIKMDVEDKIEEILDEIENSEDDFSDEKIIDELSEEFDVDGKEILAECGNVPDTVLRISEVVREKIMNKYLQG